jgi:acetyltransferase-like isoleucine patch superfamily enzyme
MTNSEVAEPRPRREADEVFDRWIAFLDDEFTRHRKPSIRAELVRDNLHHILLGRPPAGRLNFTLVSELPYNVMELAMDPGNVTLAAEYEPGLDRERFAPVKPLVWFWLMFDRTPLALNHCLGFRFRRMLGRHIFAGIGSGVKIYHGVEFTFGYELTIEDDCVIGPGALLDDRTPLTIPKGTTVGRRAVVTAPGQAAIEKGWI